MSHRSAGVSSGRLGRAAPFLGPRRLSGQAVPGWPLVTQSDGAAR
jgi:hypothetical protein